MIPEQIKLANLHAITCFLNSLLREWHEYTIYKVGKTLSVLIQIADNESIQIPLLNYSILGRHEYCGKFYLKINHISKEINITDFIDRICVKINNNSSLDSFKKNVFSSRDNIATALEAHAASNRKCDDFIKAEQSLIIGHNFHPTPKTRDKLTSTELKHYAPELKGEFQLKWLLVDTKILRHIKAKNIIDENWLNALFREDCLKHNIQISKHMLPVPMHPWCDEYG